MRLKLTREQEIAARYLRSFDMVQDRIRSSVIALERAESALYSITAAYGEFGGQGSVGDDKMARALCNVERACADMERYSAVFADEFARVESLVSEVQRADYDAGRAIRLVYLDHKGAAELAGDGFSKKRAYELVRRGLDIAFDLIAGDEFDSH